MAAAEKKDAGLALIFGEGGKKPPLPGGDAPTTADEGESSEGGMDDPAYDSAYTEYQDNPTKETFWRAVKACMGSY